MNGKMIIMKRYYLYLLSILVLVSCSKEQQDTITANSVNYSPKFYAEIDNALTRTYVNDALKVCWNEKDKLSVFTSTANQLYQFDGNTGDLEGTFSVVEMNNSLTGSSLSVDANYAVYPYNEETTISSDGTLSFDLPQNQVYIPSSFGINSNPMIAVTENKNDTYLSFKNICGYLRLSLYGDSITAKSIRLEGNTNERILGKASVSISCGQEPVITLADDASYTITLDCQDGVKIGESANNATEFWFVVPPVTFKNGFTVIIEDVSGNKYSKSTENKLEIKRNVISNMASSKVEQKLEYQLFQKDVDGIDGIITQDGAYALLKETPNNDAIVLVSGILNKEEKDYMLIDGNGFIQAMSIEDNEFVSLLYTPNSVWIIDNNGKVIAEIPYDKFPSFENEPQTRATILTHNPIYQALSIRNLIKDFLKKPIKTASRKILENLINGKFERYGETVNGFIDAVFNITDILNLIGLLDKLQEIQFFDRASLVTLPANIEDVVNVSLPCEIKNLSDNTLYYYAKQKYGDVVSYTYTLNMDVYENSSLVSSIIDTQSKTVNGNGIETFKFKVGKLNHSYGYEPSLKVDVTMELDLTAAKKAAIRDLPPGYQIVEGETKIDKKSCIIYGDKESFVTPDVGGIIYDVLNVTDKSADINCSFSKTPSGAICGIEYSNDKSGIQRQTTSNSIGERIVTLSSLQPDTRYTCKAYVQYAGETYYSETSKSFTTEPEPIPDLTGTWTFTQACLATNPYQLTLKLNDSGKGWVEYRGSYGAVSIYVNVDSNRNCSVGVISSYGYNWYCNNGKMNESFTYASGDSHSYWLGVVDKPWSLSKN